MLTDPKLRSQVDALWDKFWTGDCPIRWMRLSSFRIPHTVPKVIGFLLQARISRWIHGDQ